MSAVAAVPLRLLNHAFQPLFLCCEAEGRRRPPSPRNAWYRAYLVKEGQRNCQPRSARPSVSVPWITANRYYEGRQGSLDHALRSRSYSSTLIGVGPEIGRAH